MSPSHARKRGVKYRYYLSSAILHGQAERAGTIRRVPAAEIETAGHPIGSRTSQISDPIDDRQPHRHSCRARRGPAGAVGHPSCPDRRQHKRAAERDTPACPLAKASVKAAPRDPFARPVPPQNARPIRSETRATLVASIARGRRWLDELISDPSATTESIAEREGCSIRKINMTISLAFLAPDLVKAAIEGGCLTEWA